MPSPIRLAIADDDYLAREGAVTLLEGLDGLDVAGTAGNAGALLHLVDTADVDVVITDIRMPPSHTTEGIELARRVRSDHPGIGVVVLSKYVDPAYARELLADGAEGLAYLLKERLGDVDRLHRAVTAVAAGESILDPAVVEALTTSRTDGSGPLDPLTPRELEVLGHMATGLDNATVADRLGVSERAVEKHAGNVFRKLDLRDDPELNRRVAAVVVFLQQEGGAGGTG